MVLELAVLFCLRGESPIQSPVRYAAPEGISYRGEQAAQHRSLGSKLWHVQRFLEAGASLPDLVSPGALGFSH